MRREIILKKSKKRASEREKNYNVGSIAMIAVELGFHLRTRGKWGFEGAEGFAVGLVLRD